MSSSTKGTQTGKAVGSELGADEGSILGRTEGVADGTALGADVGTKLGDDVGTSDGSDVGTKLGDDVGTADGSDVGRKLGDDVGTEAGILLGFGLIGKNVFWMWNLFLEFDAFGAGRGFSIGAIAGLVVGDFMIGFRDNLTCSSGIVARLRVALSSVRLNLTSEASIE
jgi:hypothetical protein